ncbi:TonB-dependent receptor plug domain-containing protein [Aquirufa sp. ROCK2-A2]
MKKLVSILLFTSICFSSFAQSKQEKQSFLLKTLEAYFGKTRSSSEEARKMAGKKVDENEAIRNFLIKNDSLYIYFFDPLDLISKGAYRDTTIIPIVDIERFEILKGKSPDGQLGIGLSFIKRQIKAQNKKLNNQTAAIETIKQQELANVNSGNLSQKLIGQSSGVTVGGDNSPGATAMVRIRGFGSINSNSPLYVVDDVPVSANNINAINPNDIESVNILKDASATAIYGVRGGNGVVVIKTKKGGESKASILEDISGDISLPYTLWIWGKTAKDFQKANLTNQLQKFVE